MLLQHFTNSNSLEALISISSSKEEQRVEKRSCVYSREFQEMLNSLESEDCEEEKGLGSAKKRRLGMEQVRALEKHFEAENKLDPDRKVKLAEGLGLEPRQVAVWFQNRRARWRTKQLERDFGVLEAKYDSLKLQFTALKQEKQTISLELEELKEKLRRLNGDETATAINGSVDFKDNGSSESDSNGIFKGENDVVYDSQLQLLAQPSGACFQDFAGLEQQSPAAKWFQLPDLRLIPATGVKMEDQGLFDSDESCNIFSVDQAPTLHWY